MTTATSFNIDILFFAISLLAFFLIFIPFSWHLKGEHLPMFQLFCGCDWMRLDVISRGVSGETGKEKEELSHRLGCHYPDGRCDILLPFLLFVHRAPRTRFIWLFSFLQLRTPEPASLWSGPVSPVSSFPSTQSYGTVKLPILHRFGVMFVSTYIIQVLLDLGSSNHLFFTQLRSFWSGRTRLYLLFHYVSTPGFGSLPRIELEHWRCVARTHSLPLI